MAISSTHPRIYVSPTVLARAKSKVTANHPTWQALKSRVDAPASWDTRPISYAIAYQASGNTSYADKAIQLAGTWASQGVDAITPDSGFPCRQVLPEISVVYDLCYDRLNSSQKSQWKSQMEKMGQWVWPETNSSRNGAWGIWPSSNYFHGFMQTWMLGLALAGESSIGDSLLNQAISRFKTKVIPRFTNQWAGGYLEEGTSYGVGSLMWMAFYLKAHFSATGDSASALLGPEWYPSVLKMLLHLTTPDRSHLYPGGDQARESSAPLSSYARFPILAMLDDLPAEEAGMAKFWLDNTKVPDGQMFGFLRWSEFLWGRDDIAPIDYTKKLPTHYFMPGEGVTSSRSSWSTDATQVVMVGGRVEEDSHQDQAGNFMIWKSNWLAGCTKVWSHDGTEHFAPDLNTIILNNTKQTSKSNSRVLISQDTLQATTWTADLTSTYPDLLTNWKRNILFVKPNWIIILDLVETKTANAEKAWLLFTKNSPTQSGKTVRGVMGDSCLFSTTLLPANAVISDQPLGNSWRTNVKSSGVTKTFFLHALEVASSGQQQATPVTMAQNGVTVSLKLGNVTVEAILDNVVPALKLAGSVPPPPPPTGNQPPIANAGISYSAQVGKAIIFDGSKSKDSDGKIISYQWQFGDGSSGSGMQVTHSYQSVGSYTAALTVTDDQNAQATVQVPVMITAVPPPLPPPGTNVIFSEDFEDGNPGTSWNYNSLMGTWDARVSVIESGGVLTIAPSANLNGQHYNGYLSNKRFDLTGTSVSVEVKQITLGNANTQFAVCLDNQNFYLIETEDGNLYCTEVLSGVRNQAGTGYNATSHRFWKIRHDATVDKIIFETSPDSKTWSVRRSLLRKLPVTAMALQLSGGSWSAIRDPGKAMWDNLRVER